MCLLSLSNTFEFDETRIAAVFEVVNRVQRHARLRENERTRKADVCISMAHFRRNFGRYAHGNRGASPFPALYTRISKTHLYATCEYARAQGIAYFLTH